MMHEAAMKEVLTGVQQRQGLLSMNRHGSGHGEGQGMEQGMTPGMGHEMTPGTVKGDAAGQGMEPGVRQGLVQGQGQGLGQEFRQELQGPGFGQRLEQGMAPGFGQGFAFGQGLTQGHVPLSVQGQPGQGTGEPMVDLRSILPQLNLENNTVTDVNANVGDVAHLPCRFPQLSTLHQVSNKQVL